MERKSFWQTLLSAYFIIFETFSHLAANIYIAATYTIAQEGRKDHQKCPRSSPTILTLTNPSKKRVPLLQCS